MDVEGTLEVLLDWDGARVTSVAVASTRKDFVHALLAGRPPRDAETLLPRLFSICARAQSTAAAAAVAACRGTEMEDLRQGEMVVSAEAALEHLWRFTIDLPPLLALPQRQDCIAALRAELRRVVESPGRAHPLEARDWSQFVEALRAALAEVCFGRSAHPDPMDPEAFAAWEERSDAPVAQLLRAVRAEPLQAGDAPLLPPLGDAMLARVAQSLERNAGYSLRPRFSEATAECGALARQVDHPLVRVAAACGTTRTYRRILARFIELVDLPDRMTRLSQGEATGLVVRGLGVAPGRGIAGVETARGLLVHEAKVDGDRIAAYRIVAPTEWNFHPDGALVADLDGVAARTIEEVHRLASLAIQSLDPCVRFEVRVRHA